MNLPCTGAVALLTVAMIGSPSLAQVSLNPIGTFKTGVYHSSSAKVPAYDPATRRLFVVHAGCGIDLLDLSNPFVPTQIDRIALPGANSVAASNGAIAVAVEAAIRQDPGTVSFYDPSAMTFGKPRHTVTVGALPDMLTFTPDGSKVLVANEGEPSDSYSVDPVGSVSIIDIAGGVESATESTAGFAGVPLNGPVRIFGPGASIQLDLEPEHIAINHNASTAFVTLQENNAVGMLDLNTGRFTQVVGLGFKDHSLPGNGLDANKDAHAAVIERLPILGMYQPDAVATYRFEGATYIVTANEGDSRDYDGFCEETDLAYRALDDGVFSSGPPTSTNAARWTTRRYTSVCTRVKRT